MELSEALYGRRATREFTSQPVDQTLLEALIDAAIQAPTAMNRQPWAFCVLRDQTLLDHISREAKADMLASSPIGLAAHHFEETLASESFHIFYHAPALILICATEDSQWSHVDCTLAAENLMLAAYGRGLGTCWIGFAQSWLGTPGGRAALALPSSWIPVAPIIIGHPSGRAAAPSRQKPDVRWLG